MDILTLIQHRQSVRVLFDPNRKIPEVHMNDILEAARWAPTAHNMQNFEIVVVDDPSVKDQLSAITTETSQVFVEENYAQLSFSEEELRRKKVGLLGDMFPESWRTLGVKPHIDKEHAHSILGAPIKMCSALVIVFYDPRKRAPASDGDVLGMMSLGCVMENMWLVAEARGIGFHVQSALMGSRVEEEVKRILDAPAHLRIGFAARLGYPTTPAMYLRVRREVRDFAHRNRFSAE